MYLRFLTPLILLFLSFLPTSVYAQAKILVSMSPLYSLVSAVTKGIDETELLMPANASPHSFTLKPSHLTKVENADLIIWSGRDLEPELDKLLRKKQNALEITTATSLKLLPKREGKSWHSSCSSCHSKHNAHEHHSHHHHHAKQPKDFVVDQHWWLDPENGIIVIDLITTRLIELQPKYAAQYIANAKAAKQAIQTNILKIKELTNKLQHENFIVFHDAYQYFEKYFGVNTIGAVTLSPEIPSSIKHLQELSKSIAKNNVSCIFTEPQFSAQKVKLLAAQADLKIGVLDPIGDSKNLGIIDYNNLLYAIAANMYSCVNST